MIFEWMCKLKTHTHTSVGCDAKHCRRFYILHRLMCVCVCVWMWDSCVRASEYFSKVKSSKLEAGVTLKRL